jgi:CheY-like chemotaxis protein
MSHNEKILLVEDDPKDVELTLSALAENNIANEVAVTRDGTEALDYLYRRGNYAARAEAMRSAAKGARLAVRVWRMNSCPS